MQNTSSKHPKALWYIMAIYMWEYFSFYGMRALLILYLTKKLLFTDNVSYSIYGSFVALVYLTPIFGGILADKFLGFKRTVVIGAILMSCGHIIIGVDGENLLFLGMAFIICGYGYFKSNVPCLVGELYAKNDPKRDSAFTLLYLGGNIGSLIAPLTCGIVAEIYGWDYGFGLAGIGMIIGVIIFLSGSKYIPCPSNVKVSLHRKTIDTFFISAAIVLLCYFALEYHFEGYLIFIVTLASTLWFIKICYSADKHTRKRLMLLIPFVMFGILFWVFDEQIFTSVELFIERNVNTSIFGYNFPASAAGSVNAFSIIIGGLVIAWVWKVYKALDSDFGRMVKFMFGFIFQLICFVLLILAAKEATIYGQASVIWVIVGIMALGISELFIDPIALSEITSIDSSHNTSFLAAIYMLFTGSIAGFIGAKVADMAAFKNVENQADLVTQAHLFENLFTNITIVLACMVVLWVAIALVIRKMK
ncbi:MFS transporter [Allofrancisella guangzhouensis]|nr:oligopeptide:H+ symporter [Allofrancisella guangzhouensis]MBK2027559.1 MFS transporter [Allofrancisella guangzhouensis]MBK2044460.1 MFS transporter [Allofrancisella guangzhouensis]